MVDSITLPQQIMHSPTAEKAIQPQEHASVTAYHEAAEATEKYIELERRTVNKTEETEQQFIRDQEEREKRERKEREEREKKRKAAARALAGEDGDDSVGGGLIDLVV